MPIYEYLCLDCNLKFDYLMRRSDDKADCPKCHGMHLSKMISTFAFNSKDAQGNVVSSSSGCSGCTSSNCSSCSK